MLRPQDILVGLIVAQIPGKCWKYEIASQQSGLSLSQVFASVKRLKHASLIDSRMGLNVDAFLQVVEASRYYFAVRPGRMVRGIVTGIFDKDLFHENEGQYVWPDANGSVRGVSVEPLSKTAPFAALQDEEVHRWLGYVDAIRAGNARERSIAQSRLKEELYAIDARNSNS